MLGCGACVDWVGNCGRVCAASIAGNISNPAATFAASPFLLVYCIPTPELRCSVIMLVLIHCVFTIHPAISGERHFDSEIPITF
jgi:hypothetical protein